MSPKRVWMGRLLLAAAVGVALITVPVDPARGDEAKKPDMLAVGAHATKDGFHRGHIAGSRKDKDPLGVMGKIELSYALWTLLGEPVEDYLFYWDIDSLLAGPVGSRVRELQSKAPTLYEEFRKIAPLKVVLRAKVNFHRDATVGGGLLGTAKIELSPDLPEGAGQWQKLSVPGSPDWDDFMFDVKETNLCSVDETNLRNGSACVKKLWKAAPRITLSDLELIDVEWPDSLIRSVFDRFDTLDAKKSARDADAKLKDSDFWSRPAASAAPGTTAKPPLDLPKSMYSGGHRSFDAPTREKRRARSAESQKRQMSVRWGGQSHPGVEIFGLPDGVQPRVAIGANAVTCTKSARGFQCAFPDDFGTGVVEIDAATSPPIRRRIPVKCWYIEPTDGCSGNVEEGRSSICIGTPAYYPCKETGQ